MHTENGFLSRVNHALEISDSLQQCFCLSTISSFLINLESFVLPKIDPLRLR